MCRMVSGYAAIIQGQVSLWTLQDEHSHTEIAAKHHLRDLPFKELYAWECYPDPDRPTPNTQDWRFEWDSEATLSCRQGPNDPELADQIEQAVRRHCTRWVILEGVDSKSGFYFGESVCNEPAKGEQYLCSGAVCNRPSGGWQRFYDESTCNEPSGGRQKFFDKSACNKPSGGYQWFFDKSVCNKPTKGWQEFSQEATCNEPSAGIQLFSFESICNNPSGGSQRFCDESFCNEPSGGDQEFYHRSTCNEPSGGKQKFYYDDLYD